MEISLYKKRLCINIKYKVVVCTFTFIKNVINQLVGGLFKATRPRRCTNHFYVLLNFPAFLNTWIVELCRFYKYFTSVAFDHWFYGIFSSSSNAIGESQHFSDQYLRLQLFNNFIGFLSFLYIIILITQRHCLRNRFLLNHINSR